MNAPESPWGTVSPYPEAGPGRRMHFRWILGGLCALAALGGIAAWYVLVYSAPYALPVTISFDAEPLSPGSSGSLTVRVRNDSVDEPLLAAEVVVTLPDKTTAASLPNETASSSPSAPGIALGDIPAGESRAFTLSLDTQLDPASAVPVSATVSYATRRDPLVRFSSPGRGDLVVEQAAVSLAIDTPETVTREDDFDVTVRYRNNVAEPLSGGTLALVLPAGVTVVSSSPALDDGALSVPLLNRGQGGTLTLRMRASAAASPRVSLRASIATSRGTVAENAAIVSVAPDALSVSATLRDAETAAVDYAETLEYRFVVRNDSRTPLRDVVVSARFAGPLFVLSTISATGGVLSPAQPVVTWNGIGEPKLRMLAPGASVVLLANVRTVNAIANASQVTSTVTVTAASPTVPAGVTASGVTASATATAKLSGTATLDAAAFSQDPLGQIANAGPLPPRVSATTQYAVRWSVDARAAGLKDVTVRTSLRPGVRFTGKLGGTTPSALTYDARTGEIVWRPGTAAVNATTRAAFQVEVSPAQNQVGDSVALVGESVLTGTDAFTGAAVRLTSSELTTALRGAAAGSGQVVP